MAHGEAPEAAEGFRGEPRGEPRGEHGGEAEPGTQLSMDAMQFASSHVICGTRDQSSYVKCGKATIILSVCLVGMLEVAGRHERERVSAGGPPGWARRQ